MSDRICFEFSFVTQSGLYGSECTPPHEAERVMLLGTIHDYINMGMIAAEYILLAIILQIQVLTKSIFTPHFVLYRERHSTAHSKQISSVDASAHWRYRSLGTFLSLVLNH